MFFVALFTQLFENKRVLSLSQLFEYKWPFSDGAQYTDQGNCAIDGLCVSIYLIILV